MKIELGKIQTETSLYVASEKEEIQLDDIADNIIDVSQGDTITIYTKQVTKAEVRKSLLFFPFHILSVILRCILLNVGADYVEKKMEPYAIRCKYTVCQKDIENGIRIDYFPAKYKSDKDIILDTVIKINNIKQEAEQIPNPLQGTKVLNSFYMDMGWIVVAITALGIYCFRFGIQHLGSGRGIVGIIIGLILIGLLLSFILKIIADKRMVDRMKKLTRREISDVRKI